MLDIGEMNKCWQKYVVNVDAEDEHLVPRAAGCRDSSSASEHAGVQLALLELDASSVCAGAAPYDYPWEDGALPASAGLRHPVHWLFYTADAVHAVAL